MFEIVEKETVQGAKIKVIGVGGGGTNAIATMIQLGLNGVDFVAANTDNQALATHPAPYHIQLGTELTKGLGAGANPDVGRQAALEDSARIAEMLYGADMVFITAGMGGGLAMGLCFSGRTDNLLHLRPCLKRSQNGPRSQKHSP